MTVGLLCASASRALAAEPSPGLAARDVVESFHAGLLDCMARSGALDSVERTRLIMEIQEQTFDIPGMARTTILRKWRRLSEQDRTRWVALSRQYWAAHHERQCRVFPRRRFEILGVEAGERKGVIVHTMQSRPDADDARVDYHLRDVDGSWRIVDFHEAGRRGEVRHLKAANYAVLERRGFEALVTETNQKIEQLRRE